MSADYKTIPHANALDLGRHGHGLIVDEFGVSRLGGAVQGLQTILAVLHQRELDAETLSGEGLTFGHEVAQGLLAAAATCARALEAAIDGGNGAVIAHHGTTAYAELEAARLRILQGGEHA